MTLFKKGMNFCDILTRFYDNCNSYYLKKFLIISFAILSDFKHLFDIYGH